VNSTGPQRIDPLLTDSTVKNFSAAASLRAFEDEFDEYLPADAQLDEFAIYSRLLTPSEIAAHYALGEPFISGHTSDIPTPTDGVPLENFDGAGNSTAHPWCLAQVEGLGFCFGDSAARDLYIETALLGHPEYGDIWIGRFDEEVVAP